MITWKNSYRIPKYIWHLRTFRKLQTLVCQLGGLTVIEHKLLPVQAFSTMFSVYTSLFVSARRNTCKNDHIRKKKSRKYFSRETWDTLLNVSDTDTWYVLQQSNFPFLIVNYLAFHWCNSSGVTSRLRQKYLFDSLTFVQYFFWYANFNRSCSSRIVTVNLCSQIL